MLVERFEIRSDSGGPGTYRGGLGVTKIYRTLQACLAISVLDRLTGSAPRGRVLRLHKHFTTYSAKEICTAETTGVDCAGPGAVLPRRSRKDFLDYTTRVPRNGKFRWIVTPSSRPFVLKKGRRQKWNLTCETESGTVLMRRRIMLDRGQTLRVNLRCAPRRLHFRSRFGCVDRGKFRFRIRRPARKSIATVAVSANGKLVRTVSGAAARADWITVKNLKRRARYRIHIVAFTKKGDRYSATRRYKRCGKGAR
jgi:hypothetical protein